MFFCKLDEWTLLKWPGALRVISYLNRQALGRPCSTGPPPAPAACCLCRRSGGHEGQVTARSDVAPVMGDTIELLAPLSHSRHSPQIAPLAGTAAPILPAHSRIPFSISVVYIAGRTAAMELWEMTMVRTSIHPFERPFDRLWFPFPIDALHHSSSVASVFEYPRRKVLQKMDTFLFSSEPSTCLALAVWEEVHEGGWKACHGARFLQEHQSPN